MIKFIGTLPLETIVDVQGVLVEANVKSCTQVNVSRWKNARGSPWFLLFWH